MTNNSSTIIMMLLLGVFAIVIAGSLVEAGTPTAPGTLTTVSSSSVDLSTLSNQSVSAQGGNVTELNIIALTETQSWQGYYGNITGQVILQDANSQTFYNWTMNNFSGRVFASRSNSIPWSSINCTNSTNRTNEETYLGQVATDTDSVVNTYNSTTHPSFTVGSRTILPDTCYSTRGYVNNISQANNYVMLMLSPDNTSTNESRGVVVYTALTNKSSTGFDGRPHDFELIVGENEKTGNEGVTPYFFWTDLT